MITRRAALEVVASILGMQAARVTPRGTCPLPELLILDLGAGACSVKTIRVQQGAVWADIPVSDLLTALGAKTGGD
jgi:hypothetical protein